MIEEQVEVIYQPDLWNDEFLNDPDWYYANGHTYYSNSGMSYLFVYYEYDNDQWTLWGNSGQEHTDYEYYEFLNDLEESDELVGEYAVEAGLVDLTDDSDD